MKASVENIVGCSRLVKIEIPSQELGQNFDQVYKDIGKFARVPGYRPGHVPRDLLQTHYGEKAQEEVVKRAIPEYYLKAVKEKNLSPVAPPEIENVQFKNHTLMFSARVDVKPQVRIKAYKNLKVSKRKNNIEQSHIDQVLENLRQSKAKEKVLPQLNDAFAKELGFTTLEELKTAVSKDLRVHGEIETKNDIQAQLLEQLIKRASLDIPESLIKNQTKEILEQIKLNHILHGEKKEDVQSKEKQLQDEAGKEAIRRVKLSFILEEIAQQENIQVDEEDLDKRIEAISQRSGKNKDEVRQYLERENLIPGLKAELRNKKTMEFLLSQAKVEEEK